MNQQNKCTRNHHVTQYLQIWRYILVQTSGTVHCYGNTPCTNNICKPLLRNEIQVIPQFQQISHWKSCEVAIAFVALRIWGCWPVADSCFSPLTFPYFAWDIFIGSYLIHKQELVWSYQVVFCSNPKASCAWSITTNPSLLSLTFLRSASWQSLPLTSSS